MIFDDGYGESVGQRVPLYSRGLERNRWRHGGSSRAIDLLCKCRPGEQNREQSDPHRSTRPPVHPSTSFHGTDPVRGVTFVYGASGLLIRSSLPAGTRLITTRPRERYFRAASRACAGFNPSAALA